MLDYNRSNMSREFIHALGGPRAIACWLEERGLAGPQGKPIGEDAVSAWGHASRGIPFRWRPHMALLAKERGVTNVPDEVQPFIPAQAAE